MNSDGLAIGWHNRPSALVPCAVVTFAHAAVALAEKLLHFDDDSLHALEGVSGRGMIFLTGQTENLPWVNKAIYFGRDAEMPGILLPTTLLPVIPLQLLNRILVKNYGQLSPFAVLPEKIIPYGKAKPISRDILRIWLSENQ